ncbi:hypothetical protein HEP85_38315 [Streptomyces sp. RPA4-2]|uniref:hypothetical protein n=1 Tax=Streptomyces sp. RPA4-2 TaxID=2721244 RepID=UPI00143E1722|nr:hypothetical protein HEP85_38315 [Streptomyces sp. RPA4-2]
MNDYDPTSHSPAGSVPATMAVQARRPRVRRVLSKKKGGLIVAAGLTSALAGLANAGTSAAAVSSSSALSLSSTATSSPTATPSRPAGGGPVAGPSAGGATGIVDTTSTSGFTFSTATGVEVAVTEASSTKSKKGTHRASMRAVKEGASVLVLGTVDSATITATQVIVQPRGDGGVAAAEAAGVTPFKQGTPSPAKSVGQIPDYTEGEGTIVSGAAADKAIKAAQAVVPGGINDRVVKLSNGEYEVHNISVNWPHHIFVSKNFKVLGYE